MTTNKLRGIAYAEAGSGFPLLAIHGFTLDRRMSIGALEPLFDGEDRVPLIPQAGSFRPEGGASERRYRRLYPDLPFMGESEDLGPVAGSDEMLGALRGFVEELLPEGHFLLAGESYGGYLARGLARELGERVAGLFLLCPAIVPRSADRDLPPRALLREEPGWDEGAPRAEAYLECAVVASRRAFRRTRDEILSGIALARAARLESLREGRYAFSFDALGRAGAGGEAFDPPFPRPACFFLGRQDDSVGWRDALRLADRYPRASFHILDAAGHNAQIEQAGAFAAAFGAWIGDCEAEGAVPTSGTCSPGPAR